MNSIAMEDALVSAFDLKNLSHDFYQDPFPTYRALREKAPIKCMPDGSFFLTRYSDCDFVYRHPKLFSSDKRTEFAPKYGNSPLFDHHTTSLVFNDPPLHTRVRRLIGGALTPRAISEMQSGLEMLADQLLKTMAHKGGTADLIEDYAAAIPVEVIGNLLAVPNDEREPLRQWSLDILGALEPVVTAEAFQRGNRSVEDFISYLEDLIERRRANLGNPERDVLTRLIQGEGGDERLTPKELLHNCIFILNAGHETTTNLIGNGLVVLDQHPDQKKRLLNEPELMRSAIEEILRYESSNQLGNRIATQEVTIAGVQLPAQAMITVAIGAANRDPVQFSDPEKFDIGRSPNRHLAFGGGIHQCAGMNLARLEGTIAISKFLTHFPNYSVGAGLRRGGRARFRGFLSIPATLSARLREG